MKNHNDTDKKEVCREMRRWDVEMEGGKKRKEEEERGKGFLCWRAWKSMDVVIQ
jgi:hypothetical protein